MLKVLHQRGSGQSKKNHIENQQFAWHQKPPGDAPDPR